MVNTLPFTEIVSVTAGYDNTALVSSDGELFVCGSGARGQLGTGSSDDALQPIPLDLPDSIKLVNYCQWPL